MFDYIEPTYCSGIMEPILVGTESGVLFSEWESKYDYTPPKEELLISSEFKTLIDKGHINWTTCGMSYV